MATKRKPKPGQSGYGKVVFQGFVNVYLNKQEKEKIKANVLTTDGAVEFIQMVCEAGYKLTVSQSADGKTYTATAYGNDFTKPNAGYAMSLRHADFLTALSALFHVLDTHGLATDWQEVHAIADDNDW